MTRFISKLHIVVEAESVTEALDAMTGALTETLKYEGHIVDWSYAGTQEHGYTYPIPLSHEAPDDLDAEELTVWYERSLDRTRRPIQEELNADVELTDLAHENDRLRRDRDEWRNCAKYAVILFLVSSFAAAVAISALILGGGQ